ETDAIVLSHLRPRRARHRTFRDAHSPCCGRLRREGSFPTILAHLPRRGAHLFHHRLDLPIAGPAVFHDEEPLLLELVRLPPLLSHEAGSIVVAITCASEWVCRITPHGVPPPNIPPIPGPTMPPLPPAPPAGPCPAAPPNPCANCNPPPDPARPASSAGDDSSASSEAATWKKPPPIPPFIPFPAPAIPPIIPPPMPPNPAAGATSVFSGVARSRSRTL